MKFWLGKTLVTPEALDVLGGHPLGCAEAIRLVERHVNGDWGVVDDDDKAANEAAIANGSRILSAYILDGGEKVYVITGADRSATTVLLAREY